MAGSRNGETVEAIIGWRVGWMADFWAERVAELSVASISGYVAVRIAPSAAGLVAVCWVERMVV